jgi:hypothetical protein
MGGGSLIEISLIDGIVNRGTTVNTRLLLNSLRDADGNLFCSKSDCG